MKRKKINQRRRKPPFFCIMKIVRISLEGNQLEALRKTLRLSLKKVDYSSESDYMLVLLAQQSKQLFSKSQVNVITAKYSEDKTVVDIISGGGGEGGFGIDIWRGEKTFVQKCRKQLLEFCQEKGVKVLENDMINWEYEKF